MRMPHPSEFEIRPFEHHIKLKRSSDVLLWLVLGLVATAILWAALARIDRTTRATGRVRTDTNTQVVSNLEGGVIAAVYVKQGQLVNKGQPLFKLDPQQSFAEFDSNRAAVTALRAKVGRLNAEISGHAPALTSGDPVQAIEANLYTARRGELASTLAAGQARIVQAERAVAEASATLAMRRSAVTAAQTERDMIRPLVTNGIEPRAELLRTERALAAAGGEASAAAAALARAQASVQEARASVMRDRDQWRSQAATDLASSEAELQTRARALPALSGRLDRTVIRAPRTGRIDRVLVATVGGTVRAGEPVVEIVPEGDGLIVEAMVRPQDIGHIRLGQPANVNISAYDSAIYGGLPGHVVSISPDSQIDQRTGEIHYVVRVRTDRTALTTRDGARLPIGAGMVADVNLLGESRSVLSYLLTPITRLTEGALSE